MLPGAIKCLKYVEDAFIKKEIYQKRKKRSFNKLGRFDRERYLARKIKQRVQIKAH